MSPKKGTCLLVSGGLDSTALLLELLRAGEDVHPLYVRSGFIWEKAELAWLRRLLRKAAHPGLRPLTVVSDEAAPLLGRHWSLDGRGVPSAAAAWDSVFLPGRNILLLTHGALLCSRRGLGSVALGILKGNPFSDASARFLSLMEKALRAGMSPGLRVRAPFRGMSKRQVLARLDGAPAGLTFSCLRPRGLKHCGACSKCEERRRALGAL